MLDLQAVYINGDSEAFQQHHIKQTGTPAPVPAPLIRAAKTQECRVAGGEVHPFLLPGRGNYGEALTNHRRGPAAPCTCPEAWP